MSETIFLDLIFFGLKEHKTSEFMWVVSNASVAPVTETHQDCFDKMSCLHTQMQLRGSAPVMQ